MFKIVMEIIAYVIVISIICMILWNILMPIVFGLPKITFFQALGLYILCHLMCDSSGGKTS